MKGREDELQEKFFNGTLIHSTYVDRQTTNHQGPSSSILHFSQEWTPLQPSQLRRRLQPLLASLLSSLIRLTSCSWEVRPLTSLFTVSIPLFFFSSFSFLVLIIRFHQAFHQFSQRNNWSRCWWDSASWRPSTWLRTQWRDYRRDMPFSSMLTAVLQVYTLSSTFHLFLLFIYYQYFPFRLFLPSACWFVARLYLHSYRTTSSYSLLYLFTLQLLTIFTLFFFFLFFHPPFFSSLFFSFLFTISLFFF